VGGDNGGTGNNGAPEACRRDGVNGNNGTLPDDAAACEKP
jgi:hypothetical protein